jgi:type II secretory pathway component PulK
MKNKTLLLKKRNRGVVLILTLWMVTVLSMIAYSLAYEMRLEARLTKLKKDNLIAFQLAKAGVAKAVCDLKNDMVMDRAEKAQILDAEGDVWKNPKDKVDVKMGGGSYTVRIIDEESLLNLNTANTLVILHAIKYFLGDDQEEEAKRIALAITDWRDTDDVPSDSGKDLNENEFYRQSIAEDLGLNQEEENGISYRLKNDYFTTVEELLDVYGVTPELFYGYNPEERKEEILMEKTRTSRGDDRHIMRSSSEGSSYQFDLETKGLRDIFTVRSDGFVNINTAGEAVLTAIIAASQINDPDPQSLAKGIIEYRRDGAKEDIDNEQAFRSIGELSQVEELSGPLISRLQSLQRLNISSNHFRIIAEGTYGRAHRTIEAVVTRTWETFTVDANDGDFDPSIRRRVKREEKNKSEDRVTVESPTVRIIQFRER